MSKPTIDDVTKAVETVLAHGWGEVRVVISAHHIETVYETLVRKEKKCLDMGDTLTVPL